MGVTDHAWAAYLRARPDLYELNFWVPSEHPFTGRARPGEPFLFKTKSPQDALVGGAYFQHFWVLRVSEAWAVFGEGNGCASEADLARVIQTYRARRGRDPDPDPTIGCVVLRNPFFPAVDDEMPQPPNWGRSIVQGKTYDSADKDYDYVEHVFRSFEGGARLDPVWDRDLVLDRRYGEPVLTRNRLGQSGFRLAVLDAYDGQCAVTASRALPALDAAHIRTFATGGEHQVTNGLALRSDLHRLYDRGYIGVDPGHRIRVSPRLGSDFGNGVDLYERQERGETIRLPERTEQRPDPDALAWHMDRVFLSGLAS